MKLTSHDLRKIIFEEYRLVKKQQIAEHRRNVINKHLNRARRNLREARIGSPRAMSMEKPLDPPDSYWGDDEQSVSPQGGLSFEAMSYIQGSEQMLDDMIMAAESGDSMHVFNLFKELDDEMRSASNPADVDFHDWNWIEGSHEGVGDDGLGFPAPGLQVYLDWARSGTEPDPRTLQRANSTIVGELEKLKLGAHGYEPHRNEPDYESMSRRHYGD